MRFEQAEAISIVLLRSQLCLFCLFVFCLLMEVTADSFCYYSCLCYAVALKPKPQLSISLQH